MTDDTTQGPLAGLDVIDCTGMISGGFATAQLADFGANVIKVEHPKHGDPIREWPPFDGKTSLWWKSAGRNKRCITLDLSTEQGRELLFELIDDADLLFENFRPGTLERWDLGPETLRDRNGELIVVRLSGYGQTGPRSAKPGFGTVAEGIAGWADVNGFPDREPLLPPISLADLTAAQFAVQASMFAIFERDIGASGTGQVIDVSLYEPLFRLFLGDVEAYDRLGKECERTGNRHSSAAPRNVYATSDGHITLSASSQRIFENVMDAIGRPELVDDPRFETNNDRVENADELDAVIEEWTSERTTDRAIAEMEAADAIVGPVYSMGDIFEDEQYAARNNIVEIEDDDLGTLRTANTVPKFSRTPGRVVHAGPRHGQHNEEVYLEELGVRRERYEELRGMEVV
ncbi:MULTISPECIES: CaiB/BaiF CoA transferase family protein [Natrialba]|uniref:CAIB/BAIF family protein n=1 Tax=Natrialba aegyptia DSM 13077 TaxID=1227491 RepID=M0ANW8_9EURY|nr:MULTISPECIES: CoA transferase [Natrialba]ELY99637.1 CAIB/BAIF family protein [Natrialba aegyptia DSM 13077]